MKNNKKFTTPLQNTDFNKNNIPDISKEDMERFKKSEACKNVVIPSIKRDKQRKRSIKFIFLKNHFFDLLALLIAIASLAVSIIALLQ